MEEPPSNVSIILTSRNRNNLTGEKIYQIFGPSVIDGRNLFMKIANKYFKKTSDNILSRIEKLCKNIDGHPVAVELLAGSYRGKGISEIDCMLSYTSNDLTNVITVEPRFRSIRACFDYSFSRLDKTTRSLLLKFAFFGSPFSTMAEYTSLRHLLSTLMNYLTVICLRKMN